MGYGWVRYFGDLFPLKKTIIVLNYLYILNIISGLVLSIQFLNIFIGISVMNNVYSHLIEVSR